MAEEKENSNRVGKVRPAVVQTYAEDMAKVIKDSQGGLIKKIIHEEEKHEIEKRNLSPESKKNKFFIFMGFLLLSTALATLLFFILAKEISTILPEAQFTPLIFNDKSIFIEVKDFNKNEIVKAVRKEVNETLVKKGGVEGIYLTYDKKLVGLREFIEFTENNFVPGEAHFVSDNFLLGVVNGGERKNFFILLQARSIADIFDPLRAWENKMLLDLRGFFGLDILPETKYLFIKNFEEDIVENKNARILYDKDRKIMLMYIFADETSVVITDTPNATREIMLRLAGGRIKK